MLLPSYEKSAFLIIAAIVLGFLLIRRLHIKSISDGLGNHFLVVWVVRVVYVFYLFSLVAVIAGGWLVAERDSQLSPHLITQSINGKILNQTWVTNNTFVKYTTETYYTNGQLSYYSQPHTNEYWHIWSCFKK